MSSDKHAPPPANYNQPQGYGYSVQNTAVVAQPGHVNMVMQPQGVKPADYLVLSIISCFFCWPMAICALMSSISSRNAADAGDYGSAASQGRTARCIGIAAIVIGLLIIIGTVVTVVVIQSLFATAAVSSYGLSTSG